ncbi:cupin domain-containing protein [Maridesulfovibrio frigidus]|uniref:cupin domain-containing protein n=1 Tax=Maridesulfovibrio frigidus TaxID=340956 RepID=UPI0004E14835|nr:cupin domain-containing protein [Maridesulfovibrio frigidus]
MKAMHVTDVEGIIVEKIPYKGEVYEVKGVTIRWLSKSGKDANGQPEYGLRHFTVEPGGEIPAHNHFYLQTVYIEKGSFECFSYDPETDEIEESKICGPGDFVYAESMEPHGMRNVSETESATFLCCICNVYE